MTTFKVKIQGAETIEFDYEHDGKASSLIKAVAKATAKFWYRLSTHMTGKHQPIRITITTDSYTGRYRVWFIRKKGVMTYRLQGRAFLLWADVVQDVTDKEAKAVDHVIRVLEAKLLIPSGF